MKRVYVAACLVALGSCLAACGGDANTNFVLNSSTPSGSASASAAASGAASASPSASSASNAVSPTAIPGGGKIIIDTPDASTAITSPVAVSGTASVTNGTVVGVVLDAGGNELGRATTTASAAAPDYGHYDLSINFTGAQSGTKGQVKVYGVRSDGTTPSWYYFIWVSFP